LRFHSIAGRVAESFHIEALHLTIPYTGPTKSGPSTCPPPHLRKSQFQLWPVQRLVSGVTSCVENKLRGGRTVGTIEARTTEE